MPAATTPAPVDPAAAEAFGQRMAGVLNDAALALMTSVGHQVGLFDSMADLPPSTSIEIAARARLDERYVREWLGAMTSGRVVEYRPADRTYRLPPEHACSLTRAAGPANLAVTMQFIPLLAGVEGDVVGCFREGGGVPYSRFDEFHRLMAEDSAGLQDANLLSEVVPLVDGLQDRLEAGIDVADVGCGSGHAVNLMARAFPRSRFVGYDLAEEAVAAARREALAWGLDNARFVVCDVSRLDVDGGYDLVTAFDAVHDQADPAGVLSRVAAALRPGGVFLMVDIQASSDVGENVDHPLGPFLYTVSTMHCTTVSLAAGGAGLGTMWGEQAALAMLAEAGFTSVRTAHIDADLFNTYYVAGIT